ncbi:MAG: hypothetical protein GY834_16025 [Bacteroidetes bacterium]|jgi:hypothetical protein|nr:hypothetical protein [Bacteroidota bacterium]|tara:strand:- start:534 stop:701 length:168 start_codon:yes stop_codon:yes gene_type:complete
MDYQEMDQNFADLVEMITNDDMRVEIIFEALKTMQEHSYASPKLALEIGLNEWAK